MTPEEHARAEQTYVRMLHVINDVGPTATEFFSALAVITARVLAEYDPKEAREIIDGFCAQLHKDYDNLRKLDGNG